MPTQRIFGKKNWKNSRIFTNLKTAGYVFSINAPTCPRDQPGCLQSVITTCLVLHLGGRMVFWISPHLHILCWPNVYTRCLWISALPWV